MKSKRRYNKAKLEAHNQQRLEYLGMLLKEYRNETLLSRVDFAHEYGISRSLLERVELGKNVTLHSVLRICDLFMISPSEIFIGID